MTENRFTKTILVGAIDIGTSFSRCAFSLKNDFEKNPHKIGVVYSWSTGKRNLITEKVPTIVLFDHQRNFHSFGYEAEAKYAELVKEAKHKDWYFFKRFKQILQRVTCDTPIYDYNGKSMDVKTVVSAVIKYLKNYILGFLRMRLPELEDTDIFWVFPIPSTWEDSTRQLMTECALQAGIGRRHLSLVSKSEAATRICFLPPVGENFINFGTKFLVINLGGRTLNITAYNQQNVLCWEEIHKLSVETWAETKYYEGFFQLLIKIVGTEVFQRFREQEQVDFLLLIQEIDAALHKIDLTSKVAVRLSVPLTLREKLEQVTGKGTQEALNSSCYNDKVQWIGNKMTIDSDIFEGCFHAYSDEVIDHMKKVLRHPEVLGTKLMLMIGVFSESKIMVNDIKSNFPAINICVPNDAALTVVKGAVLYGHMLQKDHKPNAQIHLPAKLYQPFHHYQNIYSSSKHLQNAFRARDRHISETQSKTAEICVTQAEPFGAERRQNKELTIKKNPINQIVTMCSELRNDDTTVNKADDMKEQPEQKWFIRKENEVQQKDKCEDELIKYKIQIRELEKQCKLYFEKLTCNSKELRILQDKEKKYEELSEDTTLEKKKSNECIHKLESEINDLKKHMKDMKSQHEQQIAGFIGKIDSGKNCQRMQLARIESLNTARKREQREAAEALQNIRHDHEKRINEMKVQLEYSNNLLKKEAQTRENYETGAIKYEEQIRELEMQHKLDVENITALSESMRKLQDQSKLREEVAPKITKAVDNASIIKLQKDLDDSKKQIIDLETQHNLEISKLLKQIDSEKWTQKMLREKTEALERNIQMEKEKASIKLQKSLREHNQRMDDIRKQNEYARGILREKDALIQNMEEQISNNQTYHELRVQQMEANLTQFTGNEAKYKKQIRDIKVQHLVQVEGLQHQIDALSKMNDTMVKREESMLKHINILKGMKAIERREDENSVHRDAKQIGDRQSDGSFTKQSNDIVELSDPNRATGLSERYKQLYKEEWSSAFEALTDENKKNRLQQKQAAFCLLELLKECMAYCDKNSKMHLESLRKSLLHPLRNIPKSDAGLDKDIKHNTSTGSKNDVALRELRRNIAAQQDVIEEVIEVFFDEAKSWGTHTAKKGFDTIHIETCTPYLGKCVELCWLMALHDPPLFIKFDFKNGEKFDSSIYTMYSASGDKMDYLVWPPLYNGEHGELLAKGVVETEMK